MGYMSNRVRGGPAQGFTLVELMVGIAIVILMVSMAQIFFVRQQQQARAREAARNLVSLANEARTTAVLLGTAARTSRVNLANPIFGQPCPVEFSLDGSTSFGQAALVFDFRTPPADPEMNDLGMSVTYISRVERASLPAGQRATYNIFCKTMNLTYVYKDNVVLDAGTTLPTVPQNDRLTLLYNSRGFIANLPTGQALFAIGTRENQGRAFGQRVLVLGSGYACLESSGSSPPQCERS